MAKILIGFMRVAVVILLMQLVTSVHSQDTSTPTSTNTAAAELTTTETPTTTSPTTTATTTTATIATTTATTATAATEKAPENRPTDDNPSNAGAVAGGVTAALLVTTVVAVVLIVVAKRKRKLCFKGDISQSKNTIAEITMPTNPLPPIRAPEPSKEPAPVHVTNTLPVTSARETIIEIAQPSSPQESVTKTPRLSVDPIYSNLPQYDVPVHVFKRKQSYPGDLLTPELMLQRSHKRGDERDEYVTSDRVANDNKAPMYDYPRSVNEVPLYLDMQNARGLYDKPPPGNPVAVSGLYDTPSHSNQVVEQGTYANYDEIAAASSKRNKPIKPSKPTKPKKRETNQNNHPRVSQNQTSRSEPISAQQEEQESHIYLNSVQLNRLSQKDCYPGDMELPVEYTNLGKKSVPFVDEELYLDVF